QVRDVEVQSAECRMQNDPDRPATLILHSARCTLDSQLYTLHSALPTERLHVLEGAAAGEDGESLRQGLLGFGAEVVAPVDEGAQGLLPGQRRAAAGGEEAEAVVQALRDLLRRERADPRRRQFDGERDAVEAVANARHARSVRGRQREGG